jgi:hypothetical protein
MTERRDFLKVASLLPFGVLGVSEALSADAPPADEVTKKTLPASATAVAPEMPIPPQGPIEEQHFTNYQLLGTPEPSANLFGGIRPRNWNYVKAGLDTGLANAAHRDDPIHRWLRTFRLSFDSRATDIVIKAAHHIYQDGHPNVLRYEPHLYEALLRGAAVLLDRCLR